MKLPLVAILFLMVVIPSWTVEKGKAVLIRKIKENSAALVDISKDGKFILTIGNGKGRNCNGCRISIMAVYKTSNGMKVHEIATKDSNEYFRAAAFSNSQHVYAVKQSLSKSSHSSLVMMDWDFISESHVDGPCTYLRVSCLCVSSTIPELLASFGITTAAQPKFHWQYLIRLICIF